MSGSLPRRRLLSGGAAFAATAVIAAPAVQRRFDHHPAADTGSGTVVVRWNAGGHRWAARPPQADFGVVFLSTNDPSATAPTDAHVQTGDVWRRHPDAEEV